MTDHPTMRGFRSEASKKATCIYAAVHPMIKAKKETSVLSQKRIARISEVSQPSIFRMPISRFSSCDNPDALSQANITKAISRIKPQKARLKFSK